MRPTRAESPAADPTRALGAAPRQSELCSRLILWVASGLSSQFHLVPPAWSSMVKGNKRISLPLYNLSAVGVDDIPLNNFSPLAERPPRASPLSHHIACLWSGPGPAHPVSHQKTSHLSYIVVLFISPPQDPNVPTCHSCRTLT